MAAQGTIQHVDRRLFWGANRVIVRSRGYGWISACFTYMPEDVPWDHGVFRKINCIQRMLQIWTGVTIFARTPKSANEAIKHSTYHCTMPTICLQHRGMYSSIVQWCTCTIHWHTIRLIPWVTQVKSHSASPYHVVFGYAEFNPMPIQFLPMVGWNH